MNEHPILFSGPMVRAILAGRKTQTRRVVVPQFSKCWGQGLRSGDDHYSCHVDILRLNGEWAWLYCPYGKPGDRLWVRETFVIETWLAEFGGTPPVVDGKPWIETGIGEREGEWQCVHYRATDTAPELAYEDTDEPTCRWCPSIHMPRWASRITLEVTGVKAERLQDITEEDAKAEGFWNIRYAFAKDQFIKLWDTINAKRGYSWESNPWVWVISFKRVDPAVAAVEA